MFWKMKFFNCSKDKAGTRHRAKQKKTTKYSNLAIQRTLPCRNR